MKRNRVGILWKLFGYFAVFIAVILMLLWLLQIVFLNDFYRTIKINEIKNTAESIADNINEDTETLTRFVGQVSQNNDVCAIVLDANITPIISSDVLRECIIHRLSPMDYTRLYVDVKADGGEKLSSFSRAGFENNEYSNTVFEDLTPPNDDGTVESIVYSQIVRNEKGNEFMILLNSVVTPVNATVHTLTIQLSYISLILILLSVGMGFLVSKRISKPIIEINQTAKSLAAGNYDIVFQEHGYREISELASTMNYAAQELSKVEKLRQELIANISHDLRTPLTMIIGYSEVMRDIPGENSAENIQIIIDEATRLTSLVNDMLDLSKLQSGTQELQFTRFNLTKTIQQTIDRYSKLTEQQGYHIRFYYDSEAVVEADELRISQVVYNLINNAITYTGEDKKITVHQNLSGGYVRIEVADTGEGIQPEMQDVIWDRYYKVDQEHKRSAVGTGLGLSIVKSTLDLHNEKILGMARYGVISRPGEGSKFWFELKTVH